MEAPPQAAPASVPSAFIDGLVVCPICNEEAFTGAPGLMRHLTTMHQGAALDAEAAGVLWLLDRGVCIDQGCGGFRRLGMRQCNRCGRTRRSDPWPLATLFQVLLDQARQQAVTARVPAQPHQPRRRWRSHTVATCSSPKTS